jgi:hypothetical protein
MGASSICTPAFGKRLGQAAGDFWADGAHVDDQVARFDAKHDAVGLEHDVLHVGRVADAGDDDVGVAGHVGGAAGGDGSQFDEGIHLAVGAVPDVDHEAFIEQVAHHALPHDAQADKSYFLVHEMLLGDNLTQRRKGAENISAEV